jgi:hypothetical protein
MFCHLLAKSDTTTCRFRSRRVCNLQLCSMVVAALGQKVCVIHMQC